jgi:hypothetical protein
MFIAQIHGVPSWWAGVGTTAVGFGIGSSI